MIGGLPVTGASLTVDAALSALRSGLACLAGNGVADTDVVAQWSQEASLRQTAISSGAAYKATGLSCVGGLAAMAATAPATLPAPGAVGSVAISLSIALPSLSPSPAPGRGRRQLDDASSVLGPLVNPTPGAPLTAWQAKALAVLVALSTSLAAPATLAVGAPSTYAAELGQPLTATAGGYWLSTQHDERGSWPAVAARPICFLVGGAGGSSACFAPSDVASLAAALSSSGGGGGGGNGAAAAASSGSGAVIGAAAGAVVLLLAAAAAAAMIVVRRRQRRRRAAAAAAPLVLRRGAKGEEAAGGGEAASGGSALPPLATANPMIAGAVPTTSTPRAAVLMSSRLLQASPLAVAAASLRDLRTPAFAVAGGGEFEHDPGAAGASGPMRDERGRVAFSAVGAAALRSGAPAAAAAGFGATAAIAAARQRVSSRQLSKGAAPDAPTAPVVNAAGIVVDAQASRPGEENAKVGLPPGWQPVWSESRAMWYWRRPENGQTCWNKPTAP